jgi:phage regulator Rha-like protein
MTKYLTPLVDFTYRQVTTDSQKVARELGVKHAKVAEAIERVFVDYPDLRVLSENPKIQNSLEFIAFENRIYRGQEFRLAIMNKPFFTLLAMRFETKRAREIQRSFNAAFYELEQKLIQRDNNQADRLWQDNSRISRGVRMEETDAIQLFIEYAVKQGSTNANWYYKSITNATYKALGLVQYKHIKTREMTASVETCRLIVAEQTARQALIKHMAAGEHYKDIFKLVIADINRLVDGMMLPPKKDLTKISG